jgi:rhomboid protease GluP
LLRVSKRCDAAAHIGGLASGVLFGLIVALLIKIERRISVVTVTTLSVIFLISKKLQNVYLSNYRISRRNARFCRNGKNGFGIFNTFMETARKSKLTSIKDRGIYYWDENIILLEKLDKLYLPEAIHEQNDNLIEYCELRKEYYELGYKKIK